METITSEQPTQPIRDGGDEQPEEPVVPRRTPLRAALKTARPQEWIKNVFVFAGLLFSGKFNDPNAVLEATLAFVSFCAISSAGYYVNDLVDIELDRKHPKKRFRPLPAGELSASAAKMIAPLLAIFAIGLAFATVNWEVGLMVVGYGVAQMAYSLGLKQVVIVDVMTLAGLFILRVAAGASAVDAHASEWLILCTGMLAPTGTVISYAIYAVDSPIVGNAMMWTIPSAVYCIFRYLYLIYDRADDRSTAAIVAEDRPLIAGVASFALIAFLLLYVFD
jgi:4-hydroxybenzoate polyprenyltransferase